MTSDQFSVCVYCGARPGLAPLFTEAAKTVGRLIAERGWRLVYGGGHVGLMGTVADAALAHGGTVFGVIPRRLEAMELPHRGLSELLVVDTMHQRKQVMAERADAFLALPGGVGTFEELFEVWTWRQLGYHDQPIGLLNVDGYYDGLLSFLQNTVERGFVSEGTRQLLTVGTDPADVLDRLHSESRSATRRDDFAKT